MKKRRELWAHRLPLCLAVVVLGMWMGSFRAPRRWTVRSWITSRMCLIQSCLFSMLEAWGRTRQQVRRKTFTGSVTKIRAATPERLTQNKAFNPTRVIWFAILCSRHASVNGLIVKWRQRRLAQLCRWEGQKWMPSISVFVCITESVRHHSRFVWLRSSAPSLPFSPCNKRRVDAVAAVTNKEANWMEKEMHSKRAQSSVAFS